VALGFSSGGFGAHYYGNRLGLDSIYAFSGPASLDIGLEYENKQHFRAVKNLYDQGKIPWPNIRDMHAARPDINVECYYAQDNLPDARQALYLNDLPNVQITGIPRSAAHFAPGLLAEDGRLEPILARAAGLA
jgi:hypothetical protein